ncbi:MAG TPA: PhzF family phenazine biosynthesis protein [Allosphingosinicella sp.]|nr:PhzF family phenazine biosynthesis protein [Allosphingosinicella sp.]
MPELRFVQVDAFADKPFTGNPAAIVPLLEWLPDEILQAIAMENNLSETAFTVPAGDGQADFDLRWFTPTTEVDLCGHATLASGHVFMEGRDSIVFRTRKAGLLTVAREGDGYALSLPLTNVKRATEAQMRDVIARDGASIVDVIARDGASDSAPPELYLSCDGVEGVAILLFPDEAAVRKCRPDMKRLAEIDYMAIVTAPGAPDSGYDVVSRVFVPAWGVDEDPVTGSAHAALMPFWTNRLRRQHFTAFQASKRGGHLTVRREHGDRAVLGGRCVTVIEGMLSF